MKPIDETATGTPVDIIAIGDSTLVWYGPEIGVFGNCFSGIGKDGVALHIVNIGLESLQATGVTCPLRAMISASHPKRAYIIDPRIPEAAFRKRPCTTHHDEAAFMEWRSR